MSSGTNFGFMFSEASTFWEQRSSVPIWRGTPWTGIQSGEVELLLTREQKNANILQHILQKGGNNQTRRIDAVLFSREHPHLLNAKFYKTNPYHSRIPVKSWQANATDGLYQLLPLDPIPASDYYSNHQVALVLGGLGAAFRTTRHLVYGGGRPLGPINMKNCSQDSSFRF